MKREEKNEIIAVLDKMITTNSNFCLADISGLTAEESSNLRRLCFKREVSLRVVKNTLLKKAFDKHETDFEPMYNVLTGNTSIMFSNTNNSFAKVIKEFRKKHDKPILKAAHVESEFYIGDEHLSALTELKSKDELIAEIILLLQSPSKNIISALQSGSGKLSGILTSLEKNNTNILDDSQVDETKGDASPVDETKGDASPVDEIKE
ncbi:MAG: 50S ribosomal protein L10 [Bacteroidota bacterium]|nr:50S ribosomal protein L10 [Bacteroidota bacterium]